MNAAIYINPLSLEKKKLKSGDVERYHGSGNKPLRKNWDLNSDSLILGPLCFSLTGTVSRESDQEPTSKESSGETARAKVTIIHSRK